MIYDFDDELPPSWDGPALVAVSMICRSDVAGKAG